MSINKNAGVSLEISGSDLKDIRHVVDEYDVKNIAGMAARRVLSAQLRKDGMSWAKSRKSSVVAQATDEMRAVVRATLSRGGNAEQATRAAMRAVSGDV